MSRGNYGSPVNTLDLDKLPVAMQMKILRLVAGISAEGMAQRWEVSPAYVYRVERGEIVPKALEIRDAREAAAATYARAVAAAIEAVAASDAAEALRADVPDEDDDPPAGGARRRHPSG